MLCEVSMEVRACNWSLILIHSFIHSFIHPFLFRWAYNITVNHIFDVRRDSVPYILLLALYYIFPPIMYLYSA